MDFIIFLVVIMCGLFFGKRAEKKHYKSIIEREEKYKHVVVLSDKDAKNVSGIQWDGVLVTGSTVVSIDAFKKLMAGFVNIFGWRMKAYETLVDRARREAILKAKEQVVASGYNCLINLRVETSSISKSTKKAVGAVEAIAYGTALKIV